ncbi:MULTISPECIES: hypothetical protein [unclassified Cupriavidus]|jgi:hypothetical protein|uniref:hypothetical protein n=1 Tax=unclassified Cupriavidus TaxID=2640874 RepID=UPI001C008A6D|nr:MULTISPECIES: hypothetical protein [unclassified Cupriavidus]MCA3187352.1 hypothetical protein [Cupriavidus sp.]MCA3189394.1 hypothetical protein [Cupriavidus sp.]MCA3195474.1 hypothetical protein [Cupriavidus sp.]MCA3201029.1 hypothetical protein [Cupriavidus sp.]MCA3209211.1 hypothetical protein [Cupriavidus sp.]
MYMIYWTEATTEGMAPHAQSFPGDALRDALQFAEALRRRQFAGEPVSFVTLCSENPNSVGKPGAADPPPDYEWKKRRP